MTEAQDQQQLRFSQAIAVLYRLASPARRRELLWLVLLTPAAAVAEMISVASIVPLLSLLSGEASSRWLPWLSAIFTGAAERTGLPTLTLAAALFVAAALLAAVTRLALAWISQRFAFGLGHEIAVDIQRRVLSQPYAFHIGQHSSQFIAALEKVEQFLFNLLLPLIRAAGAVAIILLVGAALVRLDPVSTLIALTAVGTAYALVLALVRKPLAANSAVLGDAYDERVQAVQESLGAIRDIIVDHSQPLFLDAFAAADQRMTTARTQSSFLAVAPRYLVEAVGLIVFTLLAIRLASGSGSVTAALPVLGALALGAQRMLPLVQQLYQGWAALAASRSIVGQLFDLLGLPVDDSATGQAIEFRSEIRFEQVGFSFPTRAVPALSAIDLVIPHGTRIAIVGRTGSGKTTLTDLLMGLMPPQTGTISIDGVALAPRSARAWQRNIAHVPQSIFLADASIARNIAFARAAGADDPARLRRAASIAQIDAFIAGLPDGYDTRIGERGVRLSGGQRQRLGLARAIYKQAPVLVLDEATSALDDATEDAVLDALGQLQATGCTIIIVAHRASTISSCDRIIRLEDGRIVSDEAHERP